MTILLNAVNILNKLVLEVIVLIDLFIEKVINGENITKNDADMILNADIDKLALGADKIRKKFCGNKVNLCSIISGKGGCCSENCKFCAQSSHNNTLVEKFEFLDSAIIAEDCIKHSDAGVHRYSIVTAGRALCDNDFNKALTAYKTMNRVCPQMALCASHGLLEFEQFLQLKDCGVTRYHCNLETSERYFGNICTTHSFKDKINAIKYAKKAGLEICSGGIIGMGETMEDRIDMAFTLAHLGVKSIPINILNPIKDTPLENSVPLTEDEIIRTIAIFRYINPRADIIIAAGRTKIADNGIRAFFSGANATITGDFLTTTGSTISKDITMFKENGFEI